MTSITDTGAAAEVHAAPHAVSRNFAIDRTRTFLTIIVLIHHAMIPHTLLWGLIIIKREVLGNPDPLPHWYEASYAAFLTIFSAAMLFTIMAYFLRFKRSGWSVLDPMQKDAYGMFLVHYAFALWIQYWLYNADLPAIIKVLIGSTFTLVTSWALTRALRQIPGAHRVL